MQTATTSLDELSGRLQALEVIAMTALSLYLANSKNDADYSKVAALLQQLQATIRTKAADLPAAAASEAARYGDELLNVIAQNLRVMRGEGGQVQ